jgi:hypothetical protein
MGLTLAHALEWPGKARLNKDQYLVVQTVYYPGFTIGGFIGEFGGLLVTGALVVLAAGTPIFWLVLLGFLALAATHLVYWVLTHPINKAWVGDLGGVSGRFFSIGTLGRGGQPIDWTVLRDRWELSHAVRAALSGLSLVLLVTALAT